MADLARLLEVLERAERLGDRNLGIDAVELVEVDAVDLEPAQAHLDALLGGIPAGRPPTIRRDPIG